MARAVVVFRDNAIELMSSRNGLEQQATMLQEKLAEEQRLMSVQRNFVSMASHEFRTPLTIIDSHAQRLVSLRERLEPEELVTRARKIRSAVLRMTHLIGSLINSARLVDGRVDLYFHPTTFNLTTLLREACQLQQEITPHAQLAQRIEAEWLPIVGDANLLFQVFSNLLSNAVKYSPDGGAIQVSAACAGAQVSVCVEDHGIGVPSCELERIFDRYYRGSNAASITGTGIGLYFVKLVVGLHNGEITVSSGQRGSRFTVRLPRVCAPVANAPSAGQHVSVESRSWVPQ